MRILIALFVLLSITACKTTKEQAPDTSNEPVAEVELEEEAAASDDGWSVD